MGVPQDDVFVINLRGRRNPMSHPEDRAELAAELKRRGCEVLLVDPFGRAFTGTDQDSNSQVAPYLADLDLFARTEVGASELVLSVHAGWSGERSRGASALEDWPDAIWTMTKDADSGRRFLAAIGRDVDLAETALDYDIDTRHLSIGLGGNRKQMAAVEKDAALEDLVIELVTKRALTGATAFDIETDMKIAGRSVANGRVLAMLRSLAGERRLRLLAPKGRAACYGPVSSER